ncbi:calcium/sodium antiporter [Engelhardtia mirabilis]|uniref:calcium/sodium antiporter n=1 Tax=Engelhardtia mirabilis TaxID=2528011 RepID=UPI0011A4F1EC
MPFEDPTWLTVSLLLVAGFMLLAKGADWLVTGSSALARRIGVSSLAIGLTVVAWGTSAPEVVVSSMAALQGASAISLGNVLGSNIANIGLVLGACAMVMPRVLEHRLGRRDTVWLFGSLAGLWLVCADGALTRLDAIALLVLFAIYNGVLWITARERGGEGEVEGTANRNSILLTVSGMVGVAVGAWAMVEGAKAGAVKLEVDERIVGLTVVAVGTSLPELAAGLGSAFKGEAEISIGNVVGSNVFNLLAVLGIVGVVRPLTAEAMGDDASRAELAAAFEGALSTDLWIVLAFSVAAIVLPAIGGARLGRVKGAALLGAYSIYTWTLFQG